ncbi:MAG TPA: outer membrane beta-barrel protein, partial [Puia sp.]|nr:outer membrane beta-barrel protein [Puia sp.]
TTMQTLQFQPGGVFEQQQQSQSINKQDQHSVLGLYERTVGSRSAFQFSFHSNFFQNQNQFSSTSSSIFRDTLENASLRAIRDQTSRQSIVGDVSWRIQSGKQLGRIFSIKTGFLTTDYSTDGYLYTINSFFKPDGNALGADTVDQRKHITDHSLKVHGDIGYTQPFFTGSTLSFILGSPVEYDNPLQATFGRGQGKYDEAIDSLTSYIGTRTINSQGMIVLQGKSRHINYTFITTWLDYIYRQRDQQTDSVFHLHYISWVPRFLLNYTPRASFNVKIDYSAATQQPSISQLAPIKNNNDPLHLTLGNPNLRPGTDQKLELGFHWLRSWIVAVNLNFRVSNNSISTKTTTDSLGRQISQPVNVNGGSSAGANFSVNHRLAGIDWSLHTADSYNRTINFLNTDLNRNDLYSISEGIGASRYVERKYSFQFNTNFSWLYSRSSVNISTPLHYWTQSHFGMVSLFFVPHYEIGTNATFTWQQKTNAFSNSSSVLLWNAYVSRNFLRDKLAVKATINNLLDQNAGITRTSISNISTETSTNILGRYWMVSVMYHFDKKFSSK